MDSGGIYISEDIVNKALRLKELDKLIIKAIATSDFESMGKYLAEFHNTKKLIRIYALDRPLLSIKEIADENARLIIQRVMSGESFPVEKAIFDGAVKDFLKAELDENDIEELSSELFYSWFSHYEYLEGLYEIGALVISCGEVPKYLSRFVSEARACYVFQQFNAVFSLCRTILEVCIKDVATGCSILPEDNGNNRQAFRTPELYDLINQLCDQVNIFKNIRNQLHKVRRETNYIIHGNHIVTKQEAKDILRNTLLVVFRLYGLESQRGNE